MSLNIPYTAKVNDQPAMPVSNEPHTIGLIATATYASGLIRLVQVPQGPAPAVNIAGYVEITSGTPTGNQFLVNYTTGSVAFDPTRNGDTVLVTSYQGLGSEIAAEDINELQNPLSTIAQQTIVFNWPSAPTSITWALASGVVLDTSVSPSANITLSKLAPLTPSTAVATNGSGFLVSSTTTAAELGYVHGVTSSIQTQINNLQPSGNYITALTGDVTAAGPGSAGATVNSVGGSSAANIHTAALAANAATNLDTPSTIIKRDSMGNFSTGSVTLVDKAGIIFNDTEVSPKFITLSAPTTITTTYSLLWPPSQGGASSFLSNDGSGNLSWASSTIGYLLYRSNSTVAIDLNNNYLYDNSNNVVAVWSSELLQDTTGTASVNWNSRNLFDNLDNLSVDWQNKTLNAYGNTNLDWSGTTILSAAVHIDSTQQGFLLPRMITSEMNAIPSPAEGLMVYTTDNHQWMGYDGSGWVILG
jgi:hypothetical protein